MAMQQQIRQSVALEDDQVCDLRAVFSTIDEDGSGYITFRELGDALKMVGLDLPGYQVRELIKAYDKSGDNRLDMKEFRKMYKDLKSKTDVGSHFKKAVSTRQGVATMGGTSYASSEGTTHTVKEGEQKAFAEWINRHLGSDPDLQHLAVDQASQPLLRDDGDDMYSKMKDGILVCKLINHSVPGTIDERAINKKNLASSVYHRHENLTLAVTSAGSIGCTTVNIGPEDLEAGRVHLVLGLLWQIIRIGLLNDINLAHHPGLVHLLEEGEDIEDLMRLSPEEILVRWVNYHLGRANCDRRIKNFSEDIKDSEAYTYLLHQISPADAGVTLQPLGVGDDEARAECMLQEAEKIGCRSFIGPKDVVKGNKKLNLAFVANLFNNYPALEQLEEELDLTDKEETREEKTYRNWMNSLGVNPFVHNLYNDLRDGLVIFQLYDFIQPGLVDKKKVHYKYNKLKENFEKLENCNYAVCLGHGVKKVKVQMVGIQGADLKEGNTTLTLGLVWQLMRAYTLVILSKLTDPDSMNPIQDSQIIDWVNEKVPKEHQIKDFSDKKLSDGVTIAKVIDAIKPGIVNWDNINMDCKDNDEKLGNARYAIGLARKIGAGVYALPEDIVEVKNKMLLTVFACLMVRDLSARNLTQDQQQLQQQSNNHD